MSLKDYDVLRAIGQGTYGEVHLVTSMKDKKQYVIKKMTLKKASARERKAAEQEAKLLSNLRHPNIVSYKDSFESDSNLYIVMGFAEGGDLYSKLREHRERRDYLSEQQVVRWYIQICMALQYLHDRRILHRDLKTQNIFLTKTKMIKVGDLGIAKVLESSSDMATTLIGTPYYMSPELFSNRPYNHKSDVWALGCCIYEMVTLKHAFNAKDMNSLVYKILKGKMPAMPEEYAEELCELIKSMLHQNPEKRPSVNRILRNSFIKKHIKLFLDESSRRRPASGRSSRRTSATSSVGGSQPASRKTSSNSQGSSPSPHPPVLAPDPSKISRAVKTRSPINERPAELRQKSKIPTSHQEEVMTGKDSVVITNPARNVKSKQYDRLHGTGNKAEDKENIQGVRDGNNDAVGNDSTLKPTNCSVPEPQSDLSSIVSKELNANSNNSGHAGKPPESGIYRNFAEVPRYEKVIIHQKPMVQNLPKHPSPQLNQRNGIPVSSRASSASSSCSAESTSSKKKHRPLPEHPAIKLSSEPRKREDICTPDKTPSTGSDMRDSMESVASVASSVVSVNDDGTPRVSSARQRRRERQQRQKTKTPPIVEEIRKSRNSSMKNRQSQDTERLHRERMSEEKTAEMNRRSENAQKESIVVDGDAVFTSGSDENKKNQMGGSTEQSSQHQEVEEFMTLLHTTLNLGKSDKADSEDQVSTSSSPNSLSEDAHEAAKGPLSPVPELSESSSSSTIENTQQSQYGQNTPAATPISIPTPHQGLHQHGISKGTLRSTQRLMDRIVSLRRDCIHGLGVPLLHRAYEVLDANENEDVLQKELVLLLGPVRFEQWAGKIWQLKFCEESMFGHCGTITAI